jgi:hypothetical protein
MKDKTKEEIVEEIIEDLWDNLYDSTEYIKTLVRESLMKRTRKDLLEINGG